MRVGPYKLVRKLACGTMAEIVLAEHEHQPQRVALKLLLPALGEDPRALALFRAEAELCARLSHPGLPRVLDRGEADGRSFLALEHLSGKTLSELRDAQWERDEGFDVELAISIGIDLCGTLHYVHEQGVVHRDLSPENVMLTDEGQVKLIDFGVAAQSFAVSAPKGALVGNIAYSSPEQLEGREVDQRADLFSLGVLLYELCTEQRLFRRETEGATLLAVVDAPIPAPSTLRAGLWAELDRQLMRALERDPERRFGSAREMRSALSAVLIAR